MTLSVTEQFIIKQLEPAMQKKKFYWYWTRKEALLKAIGTGINTDLNKLEVSNIFNDNISICKGKRWIIYPFDNFDKTYIGHIVYKYKDNIIIKYRNCRLWGLSI